MVGTFTLAHISNHLAALGGIDAHIRTMTALRLIYRHPVGEAILLGAILLQVGSGLTGLRSAWRRQGVPRGQAVSGAVLAFFLLAHTTAILLGRVAWHLDTNFFYGAAPLLSGWLPVWFVPYYAAGIIAVGVHLGAVAYWRVPRPRRRVALAAPVVLAVVTAVLVLLAFSGSLFPITLPEAYAYSFAWAR